MDYEMNKNYLDSVSVTGGKRVLMFLGIITLAMGLIAFLAGLAGSEFGIMPGVVVAIIGVVMIIPAKLSAKKITDEQYDNSVKSNLGNLKEMAMNALGLDESEVQEIDPITFGGYSFQNALKIKQGSDRRYRTDKYQSVIILFTANEVHVYKYTFDTTKNSSTFETEVYFYKDIVSVSTSRERVMARGRHFEVDFFKLTTSGGNVLSVAVYDVNSAQRSINAMRALLREKKQV